MRYLLTCGVALGVVLGVQVAVPAAQGTTAADRHFTAALAAAQTDDTDLFDTPCGLIRPVMVFDQTPGPPTVMDAIFDYSVEDEVVGGLTKLGLDPAQ